MRFAASIVFVVFFQPTVTWEPCDSVCKNEYQDAVKSCEQLNEAADNADAVKLCIENAKVSYNGCLNKCE
jgi:hypothetical protein